MPRFLILLAAVLSILFLFENGAPSADSGGGQSPVATLGELPGGDVPSSLAAEGVGERTEAPELDDDGEDPDASTVQHHAVSLPLPSLTRAEALAHARVTSLGIEDTLFRPPEG